MIDIQINSIPSCCNQCCSKDPYACLCGMLTWNLSDKYPEMLQQGYRIVLSLLMLVSQLLSQLLSYLVSFALLLGVTAILFSSGQVSLHSHQQWVRTLSSPQPHQHLSSVVFMTTCETGRNYGFDQRKNFYRLELLIPPVTLSITIHTQNKWTLTVEEESGYSTSLPFNWKITWKSRDWLHQAPKALYVTQLEQANRAHFQGACSWVTAVRTWGFKTSC